MRDLVGERVVEQAGKQEAVPTPELVPEASDLVAGRDGELLGR